MSYVNDGSMDKQGRKFEETIRDALNNNVEAQIDWLGRELEENEIAHHVGGSNGHADVVIIDSNTGEEIIDISVKRKSKIGKSDGGITYKNFTLDETKSEEILFDNEDAIANLKSAIQWSKQSHLGRDRDLVKYEEQRLSNEFLRSLTGSSLINLIEDAIINRDPDNKTRLIFGSEDWTVNESMSYSEIPIVRDWKDINGVNLVLKKKNTIQSGKIKFTMKNGEVKDYGLRLRVHLNNSVSPLIGSSSSNKSSVWCMKFQQDTVLSMLTL